MLFKSAVLSEIRQCVLRLPGDRTVQLVCGSSSLKLQVLTGTEGAEVALKVTCSPQISKCSHPYS